ncbi:hypothetical protein NX059_005491 [Plenodomus lindquistii]|nr:hypothetical protein NX059_005491 [Plenodomus lindquistii]
MEIEPETDPMMLLAPESSLDVEARSVTTVVPGVTSEAPEVTSDVGSDIKDSMEPRPVKMDSSSSGTVVEVGPTVVDSMEPRPVTANSSSSETVFEGDSMAVTGVADEASSSIPEDVDEGDSELAVRPPDASCSADEGSEAVMRVELEPIKAESEDATEVDSTLRVPLIPSIATPKAEVDDSEPDTMLEPAIDPVVVDATEETVVSARVLVEGSVETDSAEPWF